MSSVYEFRAYCPICNTQMRAERVLPHLEAHHAELETADLKAIDTFIAQCAAFREQMGLRLELDLSDLTFRVLSQPTVIPQELIAQSMKAESNERAADSFLVDGPLTQCKHCRKLVFSTRISEHEALHRSVERSAFPKLRLLPKYATTSLPMQGWFVQGGAPGLGRRA